MKQLILLATTLLGSILILPAKHTAADNPPLSGWMQQFNLNETPVPVPDFAFRNSTGETVSLNTFHGKVLLVNFWATWCAPCIRELPSLDRLQAVLGGADFKVLAINSDRRSRKVVQPFLENLGISHLDIYFDEQMVVGRALGVKGLPATFLVSRGGMVIGSLDGVAEWDSPETFALVRYYQ